jgi:hypothetical protein
MMKKHSVENGAFRMTRAIDSRSLFVTSDEPMGIEEEAALASFTRLTIR